MKKITRIVFLVVGCITPIIIGILHTTVYFTELVTPDIEHYLQKEFVFANKSQPLWHTWGIANFMMGVSFIIIGILNSSMLKNLTTNNYLPIIPIIAMILYQFGVAYVGVEFGQSIQLYGGFIGALLLIICLVFTIKQNKSSI